MAVKSVANCVSISSESYVDGYATLIVNEGTPLYFHCNYIDMQEGFSAIVRYQGQDSVGTDWTDISDLTGEGIFVINTVLQNVAMFDISQVGATTIAGYVGAGFFTLLPLWAAVYGGRQLINAISS